MKQQIIILAILGGLLMFGILHYTRDSAKSQTRLECVQGDQKADQAAAEAQHQADQEAMAELQAHLRRAQAEAAEASAKGKLAEARAAKLSATIAQLEKTDPTFRQWQATPLPAALQR